MISIRNSSYALLAVLKKVPTATRTESINAENELSFTAVLDAKATANIVAGNVIECEDDYFDIVYYQSQIGEDGTATVEVDGEHVSYRLNDDTVDSFGMTGTPTEILTAILSGTDFTIGTVEPTASGAYTINEKTTRRGLLIGYANAIGAELSFSKFAVSLLTRRGSDEPRIFTAGKNLRLASKTYNGRQSPALVSYEAEPIGLPDAPLSLGDDVKLVQPELGIDSTLRIITLAYNPLDSLVSEITISNYIVTLENQFYQMTQTSLTKDKVYHGVKLGPDNGLEITRTDNKARALFNSGTLSFQIGDGTGGNWVDKLYYDSVDNKIKFTGDINMLGGSISWNQLSDKPTIITTSDALAAWVGSGYATYINSSGVYTGIIGANHAVLANNVANASLNFDVKGSYYITLKATTSIEGTTLVFCNTQTLGGSISRVDQMDLYANDVYLWGDIHFESLQNIDLANCIIDFSGSSIDFNGATVYNLSVPAVFS